MKEHVRLVYENCTEDGCPICDGSLYECAVCGLFGGALTSECPGEESYRLHADAVYAGEEDFVDGKWQRGRASPHCPSGSSR